MAFYLVSIVFVFEFMAVVYASKIIPTFQMTRFLFFLHIEVLCFTANIFAYAINGLIRVCERGRGFIMNKKATQNNDFLKGALEGNFASWFSVEICCISTLAYTYIACKDKEDEAPVAAILRWWLPV